MQIQSNGVFTENIFPCCQGLCCRIKLATLIITEMMALTKHEMVVFTKPTFQVPIQQTFCP